MDSPSTFSPGIPSVPQTPTFLRSSPTTTSTTPDMYKARRQGLAAQTWIISPEAGDDRTDDPGPWPMEDGRLAPERPKRYGSAWSQAFFRAEDILEADPDYQFLVLVAGFTGNRNVERLYRQDSAEIMVREINDAYAHALQARQTIQRYWEPYLNLRRFLDSYEQSTVGGRREFESTERNLRRMASAAHAYRVLFNTDVLHHYVMRAALTDGRLPEVIEASSVQSGTTERGFYRAAGNVAKSLSWLWQKQYGLPVLAPSLFVATVQTEWKRSLAGLLQPLILRAAAPTATLYQRYLLTLIYLSWLTVTSLPKVRGYLRLEPDPSQPPGDGMGELILITSPPSTVPPAPATPSKPGATSKPGTKQQQRGFPVQVWHDWIVTILLAWRGVSSNAVPQQQQQQQPSTDFQIDVDEDDMLDQEDESGNVLANIQSLQWIQQLAAGTTKQQRVVQRRRNREMTRSRLVFNEALVDLDESVPLISDWIRGQQQRIEQDLEQEIAASLEGLETTADDDDDNNNNSSNRRQQQRLVRNLAEIRMRLEQIMDELDQLRRPPGLPTPLATDEPELGSSTTPSPGLSTVDPLQYFTSTTTSAEVETEAPPEEFEQLIQPPTTTERNRMPPERNVRLERLFSAIRSDIENLDRRSAQMREAVDTALRTGIHPIAPEFGSLGLGSANADIPSPDPAWALHPRFTRRITLTADVQAAINNAFAELERRFPALSPKHVDVAIRERAFKHTPIFRSHYANLVANEMQLVEQRFPRQWQLEKARNWAVADRVSALERVGTWVWDATRRRPVDTGERLAAAGYGRRLGDALHATSDDPNYGRVQPFAPTPVLIPESFWSGIVPSESKQQQQQQQPQPFSGARIGAKRKYAGSAPIGSQILPWELGVGKTASPDSKRPRVRRQELCGKRQTQQHQREARKIAALLRWNKDTIRQRVLRTFVGTSNRNT